MAFRSHFLLEWALTLYDYFLKPAKLVLFRALNLGIGILHPARHLARYRYVPLEGLQRPS